MWWESVRAVASADIWGVKEFLYMGLQLWLSVSCFSFFHSYFTLSHYMILSCFCVAASLRFCISVLMYGNVLESPAIGPRKQAKEESLLVRSAGTCSKQMFTTHLECVCVHLHPAFPCFPATACVCFHFKCIFVCVCVFAFPYSFRSTLWFLPLQAPSPSMLCDRTPAVQQSFNERSTWERRNEEREDEKDFVGLFLFFSLTTPPVPCQEM